MTDPGSTRAGCVLVAEKEVCTSFPPKNKKQKNKANKQAKTRKRKMCATNIHDLQSVEVCHSIRSTHTQFYETNATYHLVFFHWLVS